MRKEPGRFAGIAFRTGGFRKLGYVVLTSSAVDKAVFYIDDVRIAPAE